MTDTAILADLYGITDGVDAPDELMSIDDLQRMIDLCHHFVAPLGADYIRAHPDTLSGIPLRKHGEGVPLPGVRYADIPVVFDETLEPGEWRIEYARSETY